MEPLPDLGSLSDEDLKKLIDDLETQEHEVSYQRRMLHGKIDILRAELVARLQATGGKSVLDQVDVDRLTAILTGKNTPRGMTAVYCSECGFQNPEAANYCSRCGALLEKGEPASEATQSLTPEDVAELAEHRRLRARRAGARRPCGRRQGGGELPPAGARTRIGRSPDCEIFLDDVTVSRNHAVLVERERRVRASRTRAR